MKNEVIPERKIKLIEEHLKKNKLDDNFGYVIIQGNVVIVPKEEKAKYEQLEWERKKKKIRNLIFESE